MKTKKTKTWNRMLSLLLTTALLLSMSGVPTQAKIVTQDDAATQQAKARAGERELPKNPVHHCTKKNDGTDTTDWSYVYFGSYPQTEVTGDALTPAIVGASYDENGDAWVDGVKYRRISKSDTNNDEYFGDSEYRYFKWERIRWRVLQNNGSTLLVMADKGLDCKAYNEEYTNITWEDCTLRNWLNGSFYQTAFSSAEQGAVVEQNVVNEDNPEYGIEGGNNTKDKVYLLSSGETANPTYGFCEDDSTYSVSRHLKTSDYAHARGASIDGSSDYPGNCSWWLRSPGYYAGYAALVTSTGCVITGGISIRSNFAADVPALHINLSSDLWSLADDGSSGEGGGGGTGGDNGTGGIENIDTISENDIKVQVHDMDEIGKILPPSMGNSTVTVDKFGSASTDAEGKAVIKNTLTDQPLVNTKISVTKKGYREYYFYTDIYNKDAELLWNNNYHTVYMTKLKEGDKSNPYISTLMSQDSFGKPYNILTFGKTFYSMGESQNIELQMNAVWNGKTPSSYVLYQENGSSYTSTDGKFQLDMGWDFKAGYPIYAKLVAADGTTVTEKTNIEIKRSPASLPSANGLNLIDTDSTGTLGENVAFLSGENIGVKLKGVKIDISVEAGKIRVTIGKTLSEGEALKNEEWEEWKKLCEDSPKDWDLSQWKDKIDSLDMDYSGNVKGETEVCGYLEGTANRNGGGTILTGKLKLKASASAEVKAQYTVGIIPVYAKISFGVEGEAEGAFSFNLTEKKIDAERSGITLSIEPFLAGEGGVGVMAVATVGVEGKGSLPFSTKIGTKDGTKLSLKGSLSLKVKMLKFDSYSLTLAEREKQLLPTEKSRSAARAADVSELSMDDFQVADDSYLDKESLWLGDSSIQPFSLETTETGAVERVLKTNINPDAEMQMVTAGDTKMILWTEGDSKRAAINNSKLVYSIYNAADGTWSEPQAVADDGTADFAPSVVSDGEHIYVAWQNISREFTDEAGLSEVAAASTAAMSVWTAGEGFSEAIAVSEPGCMAATPKIALNAEGKPYIAYLQNTENNLLFTTGQNNICYSVVDGNNIEYQTLVESAGLVMTIDTSYTDGYEVSYTLDTDNDLSTLDDRRIRKKGTNEETTKNRSMDSNAQYVKNGVQTLRFWYRDGSIVMFDMNGKETIVYQDDTGTLTDDFHVVSGQYNQLAVVWTTVDKDGNKQIGGSLYDPDHDTWTKSIQISDTDTSVYNPQGIFTKDGSLQFLYKKAGETQTDLCVLMAKPSVNLAVENAYCDETSFVPGSMAKVRVQVKNLGSQRADGFTIDIEGTKTTVSESLMPGESMVVEADYTVPAEVSYQEIQIAAETERDIDTADNQFSLSIGYTDLAINMTDSKLEAGHLVEVHAANQSCVNTTAALEIRKDSRDGELVERIDLGAMKKGELVTATYLWNEEAENYSADTETLYFNLVSEKPEKYTENNYDFAVTGKEKDIPACTEHTWSEGVITKYPTSTKKGEKEYTCIICGEIKTEQIEREEIAINPIHHCTKQNNGTDTTDWSYVYFGSYPQTEVTGNALTSAIVGASYDGNGDAWVDGEKYRRISKNDANCNKYFGDSEYRYFKWKPIKWRVLQNDGKTLFIAADRGLDCEDFNKFSDDFIWEGCRLRNWLNGSFYTTAFSSEEQNAIVEQNIVNDDNPKYGTEGGNNTTDRVYLLSIGEAMDSAYGFCEDYNIRSASRRLQVSDYARARGSWLSTDSDYAGNCWWLLRTPGSKTDNSMVVTEYGSASTGGYNKFYSEFTVAPALHINLSSDLWSFTDDDNSGGGDGTGDDKPVCIEHIWSEGVIIKAPTCTQKGEKEFTCTICGETKTEEIEATGHQNTEVRGKQEATCKIDGYSGDVYCKDCNTKMETGIVIAATGRHTWDNGKVTKAPTCTQKGKKRFTCTICGEKKTEELETTVHIYKTAITKATTARNGSVEEKCSGCGKVRNKKIIYRIKSAVLKSSSYTYNGKAKKPAVIVKDSSGRAIGKGNYTVTYKNNKKVGRATVTIKLKGNYTGKLTKTFQIVPKGTSFSGITTKSKGFIVKWKKQKTFTTGYQVQYSTSRTFAKKATTTKTVKKNTVTKLTVKKLKAKKKYYFRVRTYKTVKGKKYCSSWSAAKTVRTKK